MSRIGRKALEIPKGVQVSISGDTISTKGPKGTLSLKRHKDIEVKQTKDEDKKDVIVFERKGEEGSVRAAHGLMRALVGNMLTGVTTGFTRQLEINGVGYKAEIKGKKLVLSVGYANTVPMEIPSDVQVALEGTNKIHVTGADKQAVGEFAAQVRKTRKPEPYKGKGIRYEGEAVKIKPGKAFAGAGAK